MSVRYVFGYVLCYVYYSVVEPISGDASCNREPKEFFRRLQKHQGTIAPLS